MHVYLGVDQALQKIGVCVLIDGGVALSQKLMPPPDCAGAVRLAYLRTALQNSLESFRGVISGAALEGQSYGSIGQLDQLGQINGVVQVVLVDLGVTPLVVPPATLKKFVTGSGHATKEEMAAATANLWNEVFRSDDEVDAHGLARLAKEYYEPSSTWRYQVEAVASLRRKKKRVRVKKLNLPNL